METSELAPGGMPPLPPRTPDERQWSVILNVAPLLGLVFPAFGNILAPLIVWLVKKVEMPVLDAEGRSVLNSQISWSIWMMLAGVIGAAGSCFVVPLLLPLGFFVAWIVCTVMAALKASNGEPFVFPLTLKFL